MVMRRLGLHNSVAKASFATVTGRSLALGLETQYPRGFSKLGDWWRGTAPRTGMQRHSACWEASTGQLARVSIQWSLCLPVAPHPSLCPQAA